MLGRASPTRPRSLGAGRVASSSFYVLLGSASRIGAQTIAFLVGARLLGPEAFGEFAAALALVTLASTLTEAGGYVLLIRDVSAGERVREAAGNTLGIYAVLTLPAACIVIGAKLVLLPAVEWSVLLGAFVAVFVGARLYLASAGCNLAHDFAWRNAVLDGAAAAVLLLTVSLAWLVGADLHAWSALYALQYVLVGTAGMGWSALTWGLPRVTAAGVRRRLGSAVHIGVGSAAQAGVTDLDKLILSRLDGSAAVGIYSVACRVVAVSSLPVGSAYTVLLRTFFYAGVVGSRPLLTLAGRTAVGAVLYGGLAGAVLWFLSGVLPGVVGPRYDGSALAIRYLALVPLLQGLYAVSANSLLSLGAEAAWARLQVAALVVNAVLNVWLVPYAGWTGSATASVVTQVLQVLCTGSALLWRVRWGGSGPMKSGERRPWSG